MNPLRWIRWKVVVTLAVLGGALWLLGANPLARWRINSSGSHDSGASWSVSKVAFGLLHGDVELFDLLVAAAKVAKTEPEGEEKERVFNTDEVRFDLSVGELTRRHFVIDEVGLTSPHMEIRRRKDGSTNVGDLGGSGGIDLPDAGKALDWVRSVKDWYEKLQNYRKKLPSGDDDPQDERTRQEKLDYWQRKVAYPYRERPTYLVRRIYATGLEVDFKDEDEETGKSLPRLTDGEIEITGLSSSPSSHDEPTRLDISGDVGGSKLSFVTSIDFRGGKSAYSVDIGGPDRTELELPVSIVEAFIGDSLPVRLESGKIGVRAHLSLGADGEGSLVIDPVLSFTSVKLARKPGKDRVAGLDANRFIKAFNEASESLGAKGLNIADLRIVGTIDEPDFQWGHTVEDRVKQGGKAFAQQQINKLVDKVAPKVDKALDKTGLGDDAREKIGDLLNLESILDGF